MNSPTFKKHQYEFTAHIRDPERNARPDGIEDRRMGIYRDLFYNNVEGFLLTMKATPLIFWKLLRSF